LPGFAAAHPDIERAVNARIAMATARTYASTMSVLRWFAVRVRIRHEQVVAAWLVAKNYEVFLPLQNCRRVRSGRVEEIQMPLFSGYVFCRIDFEDRSNPIVTTPGVLGIVGFGGTPAAVSDSEIESLRSVLKSGMSVEPWNRYSPGSPVRICRGPLSGVEGTLVEVKRGHHLIVSISLLQRSVMVKIDPSWLTPANDLIAS
jgi:transcription antitermination factor NusG